MPLPVTSLYAALLTALFLVLSVRVIGRRGASGVLIGTGGDPDLERAARVHANFAEYVPLALVLMALAELARQPSWLLHAVGLALLLGRLVHAVGLSRRPEVVRLRAVAMALTFTPLTLLAVLALVAALRPGGILMALSARGWRFVYGGLAVITAISFAPLLSVVVASATGSALGCRLDEGDAHPCPLAGQDIGDLLYAMVVMGWLMLVTWPGMLLTGLAWPALLVWAVVRRARRVEAR